MRIPDRRCPTVPPGPAALVPVLATLALIVAGAGGGRIPTVSRLLGGRGFVWLGSIAYGLYLWHWPVLIFYLSWQERLAVGLVGGFVVFGVSVLLAWAIYTWVEMPYANAVGPPRRIGSGG